MKSIKNFFKELLDEKNNSPADYAWLILVGMMMGHIIVFVIMSIISLMELIATPPDIRSSKVDIYEVDGNGVGYDACLIGDRVISFEGETAQTMSEVFSRCKYEPGGVMLLDGITPGYVVRFYDDSNNKSILYYYDKNKGKGYLKGKGCNDNAYINSALSVIIEDPEAINTP